MALPLEVRKSGLEVVPMDTPFVLGAYSQQVGGRFKIMLLGNDRWKTQGCLLTAGSTSKAP